MGERWALGLLTCRPIPHQLFVRLESHEGWVDGDSIFAGLTLDKCGLAQILSILVKGTSPPRNLESPPADAPLVGRGLELLFERRPDGSVVAVSISRRRWLAEHGTIEET